MTDRSIILENLSISADGILRPDISVAINTLTAGGHLLGNTARNPGYLLLHTSRYDEFGQTLKYCFLISENRLTEEQIQGANIAASHAGENLVVIGHGDVEYPHIEWESFINLFGGPVITTSPLEAEFSKNLDLLGHNQLPSTLSGKADDLFELFVHAALEFILGGRVVRYGQARLFEERPDGLAIPDPDFVALYDAKAYSDGYEVSINTIRQFHSYINFFNSTYSAWYKLKSFILVSGHFPHNKATLERRSHELLAKSGIPLSFLNTTTLSEIVSLLKDFPLLRRSVDWARVLTAPIVDSNEVKKQVAAILRDEVVKG